MTKTIVALVDYIHEAERVLHELIFSGFGRENVGLVAGGDGLMAMNAIGVLTAVGIPEDDAELLAEGMTRGGCLVAVSAGDGDAEKAADILRRHGAVDIENRAEAWLKKGWTRLESEFRKHFRSSSACRLHSFERFRCAYGYAEGRYGDPDVHGKGWPEVEEDFHDDWEKSYPGTWSKFREAICYGWSRVHRH